MTEQDYKTFFDDAPLALLRTDLETGQFLMANKFAATLLGCESVEDLLTKKSSDFYSATIRNKLIRKLKKNGTIQDQEIEMNVNGKHIWVKANLRINCGGTCVECFLSDITELVEMRERELLKMKCLSEKIDVKMAALAS
jgi:PAS domain S-box-containing protein